MQKYAKLVNVPDGGFVVAEEFAQSGARQFLRTSTAAEFFSIVKPNRTYHEIIRYPSRILLDIDNATVDIDAISSIIENTLLNMFPDIALSVTLILMNNSEKTDRKHIVVNIFNSEGKEVIVGSNLVAKQAVSSIPGIDLGIYSRNASLRLPMCPKFGKTDKYLVPEGVEIFKCIGHVDETCIIIGTVNNNIPTIRKIQPSPTGIEEWLNSQVLGTDAQYIDGKKWQLKRVFPGFCRLCRRIHDNTDLIVERTKVGKVWLKCPKYAAERTSQSPHALFLGLF